MELPKIIPSGGIKISQNSPDRGQFRVLLFFLGKIDRMFPKFRFSKRIFGDSAGTGPIANSSELGRSSLLQGRALYGPIPVKTETFRELRAPLVHTSFGGNSYGPTIRPWMAILVTLLHSHRPPPGQPDRPPTKPLLRLEFGAIFGRFWSFSTAFDQFWSRTAKIDSKSALSGVAQCDCSCRGGGLWLEVKS